MRWAAAILTILALCTGCWDSRDINDRSPALSLAIDLKGNMWTLTVSNVKPQGGEATMYNATFEAGSGPSLSQATENLRQHLAYRLYYGSLRTIAIGTGVFDAGRMGDVMAYLHDEREASLTDYLVASTTRADTLLRTKDVEHGAVAVRLERQMSTQESLRDGHAPVELWQALGMWFGPSRSVYLPLFRPEPDHGLVAEGTILASARNPTPVRLGVDETLAVRWLLDQNARATVAVPDGTELRTLRTTTSVGFVPSPSPHLALTLQLVLEPKLLTAVAITPSRATRLSTEGAAEVERRVSQVLAKLNDGKIDVWRGAEALRRAGWNPEEVFRLPVHVIVTASVRAKQAISP